LIGGSVASDNLNIRAKAHLEKVFQQRHEAALQAMDECESPANHTGRRYLGLLAGRVVTLPG
jgi:hypothetical protein